MGTSIASAVCLAASAGAATATDSSIISIVSVGINAAILIANAVVEIYRKWRDRDADLKKKKDEEKIDE